jgi:hypothetical protein
VRSVACMFPFTSSGGFTLCFSPFLAVAAMVAKGVKLTATGYEYPTDYSGPHLPEPSALPSDDAAALAMVAYGGVDTSAGSGFDYSTYSSEDVAPGTADATDAPSTAKRARTSEADA